MMSNFEYRQDKMGWLACIPVDDKWLMGCIWARVMQCTLHPHHLWKNGKQNARSRGAGKKKVPSPAPGIARDVGNKSEHQLLAPAADS